MGRLLWEHGHLIGYLKSGYWILDPNAGNFIVGKGENAYIYIKWALIKRMGLGLGPSGFKLEARVGFPRC